MLEQLAAAEPDPIIALIAAFRDDPRPDKIDLGVGVYRDAAGRTPVFAAVKAAEERLWREQDTKTYLGLEGDRAFVDAAAELALGADGAARATGAQAVGGSGALFALGRLAKRANPEATAHLPDPTWPNHRNLLGAAGLKLASYPYMRGGALDFDAMRAALERLGAGDVVVLHACCHNPTGIDPTPEQWAEIGRIAAGRGWTPLFDMAYLGFGQGLEPDAQGMRAVLAAVPEALVALSFSKSMGLYRDRVGAALVVTGDADARARAQAALAAINRETFSMPPDHGAAAARLTLTDPALRAMWIGELDAMRARVAANRAALASALARATNDARWARLAEGRGMFSTLELDAAQVRALRERRGVYMAPGGRINFAGLDPARADQAAAAIAETL
ncbi:amino acid aminotransferase [Oceanicella actignis]|uniref:Aminotransferase n=1 Tax=Oceanicella actignis TaxID=1189325 RepID=A0A1M7T9I0_9RHOB|nr:aromatic amino acid transaminase [Oceanicella actignis]SET50823.1 aromatic-amino-acid transaminase [Oceanicella actignis]SHN67327.1 aromatic-amino-acid transaminase [Oceanicella actignis]